MTVTRSHDVTDRSHHPGHRRHRTFRADLADLRRMAREVRDGVARQHPIDFDDVILEALDTGIDATVRLATAPELAGVTGRFYDRRREARADAQAYDARARRRMWDLSADLTGVDRAR